METLVLQSNPENINLLKLLAKKLGVKVVAEEPNLTTLKSILEAEKLIKDPDVKRFKSADDLFANLEQ